VILVIPHGPAGLDPTRHWLMLKREDSLTKNQGQFQEFGSRTPTNNDSNHPLFQLPQFSLVLYVASRVPGLEHMAKPAMCSWRKIIFKHLPLANNFKICSHYKCKYSIENEMLLVHLIVRWIFSIITSLHLSLLFTTHVFMYVFLSLFMFLI